MGKTKSTLIRRILVKNLAAAVPIPSNQKHKFEDGYDACVIVQVSRNLMRVALSVSSGKELVIPAWLNKTVRTLADDQGVEDVSFWLSARPIWLVRGEQDAALKEIWSWKEDESTWDSLSKDERREVALRWIIQELGSANHDVLKQLLHDMGL